MGNRKAASDEGPEANFRPIVISQRNEGCDIHFAGHLGRAKPKEE
jgi:hypothetical protein